MPVPNKQYKEDVGGLIKALIRLSDSYTVTFGQDFRDSLVKIKERIDSIPDNDYEEEKLPYTRTYADAFGNASDGEHDEDLGQNIKK